MLEELVQKREKNNSLMVKAIGVLSVISLGIDLLHLNFDNLWILLPLACMVVIVVCYVKNRNISNRIQNIKETEGIKTRKPAPILSTTAGKILFTLALLWLLVWILPGDVKDYPVIGHVPTLFSLVPFMLGTYTIIQDSDQVSLPS